MGFGAGTGASGPTPGGLDCTQPLTLAADPKGQRTRNPDELRTVAQIPPQLPSNRPGPRDGAPATRPAPPVDTGPGVISIVEHPGAVSCVLSLGSRSHVVPQAEDGQEPVGCSLHGHRTCVRAPSAPRHGSKSRAPWARGSTSRRGSNQAGLHSSNVPTRPEDRAAIRPIRAVLPPTPAYWPGRFGFDAGHSRTDDFWDQTDSTDRMPVEISAPSWLDG